MGHGMNVNVQDMFASMFGGGFPGGFNFGGGMPGIVTCICSYSCLCCRHFFSRVLDLSLVLVVSCLCVRSTTGLADMTWCDIASLHRSNLLFS
jgi:hypothetical protein